MIYAQNSDPNSYQPGRPGDPLQEVTITVELDPINITMPKSLRPRSASPSAGAATSEFRLAWLAPMVVALLAALLEFAGKLPAWAQSPIVLSVALFCGALIVCAYIISRGLAKSEFRGDPPPRDGL